MRHYLAALILLFTVPAIAQADARIGYVNTARVLKDAPQAEAARKKLENEFAPRDARIVDMQKTLKLFEDKLSHDAAIMNDLSRKKQEHEIISLKRDIKRAKEEFNEDLNFRRNEELSKLQKLVYDTILAVSRDEKYDVVLGESVLYASNQVDITARVLERLRTIYKSTEAQNK